MSRNNSQKYGWWPVVLGGALVLALALGARYGLIENGVLPRDCTVPEAQGAGAACALKWALVQLFHEQRLGIFSLVCGGLGFALTCRRLAWPGWLAGLAGLVLYNYDYAAVGALLALLVLTAGEHQRQAQG
ncbi:hypothetical protein [Azoarcus olearius]|uniref:Conserved hypothetical membrane protein n=1 Tax=Azoarcus sp. (strain BH72) TaxID=418699 RepID=A1K4Z5_AZOSB|nr:hypothetical protein [Azoarcus olearius]ANQ84451.1 hypothetical protein dqs_1398 [Azoarcus olearius]CAL93900.1 conserved hypothetical membrane protein [Azoarcus olearius]